jgi:hypothetical protein
MAHGNFILDKGYDAGAALTIYRAVKFSGEQSVVPVTAITDVIAGVAQFGVTTTEINRGKGASIRVMGASEWEAGGLCTVGLLAGLMADGRVHNAVTGERVVGNFRQGAVNAGDRASVNIDTTGHLAP